MGPPQPTLHQETRHLVCQPRNAVNAVTADICPFTALGSFNLECPVHHDHKTNLEHPVHPNPPIDLDRPVKPPSVTKDLPEINLDCPRVQKTRTELPNLELQHCLDRHSLMNLDRPVRPPAVHNMLNLDCPVRPLAVHTMLNLDCPVKPPPVLDLTDKNDISVEHPVSPDVNFEHPTTSTLSLDRLGRKRSQVNFDFFPQQPTTSEDVRNLNLDRPHKPV